MGTNENSKNIFISHDITFEERRRFETKRKERKIKNQRELISPLTKKLERVNKSEKK